MKTRFHLVKQTVEMGRCTVLYVSQHWEASDFQHASSFLLDIFRHATVPFYLRG